MSVDESFTPMDAAIENANRPAYVEIQEVNNAIGIINGMISTIPDFDKSDSTKLDDLFKMIFKYQHGHLFHKDLVLTKNKVMTKANFLIRYPFMLEGDLYIGSGMRSFFTFYYDDVFEAKEKASHH